MADLLGATVIEPVRCELTSTSIRADWLQAWQRVAEDPDDQPLPWLYAGAPAGIRRYPEDKVVVPEASSESDVVNHETIAMDFATFASYTGSDVDQHVIEVTLGTRKQERTFVLVQIRDPLYRDYRNPGFRIGKRISSVLWMTHRVSWL